MLRKIIIFLACLGMVFAAAQGAYAGKSPFISGVMERFEYHSSVANDNSTENGNDYYLYTILFLSRKLNNNHTGTFSYINKYGMKSGDFATNIVSLSLARTFSKRWKDTFSYSHVDNASRTTRNGNAAECVSVDSLTFSCPEATSDWLSGGVEYNTNPAGKKKRTVKAGLTYNTAPDLSEGRMLITRASYKKSVTKKASVEAGNTIIYGLNKYETGTGTIGGEINAVQYFITGDYSLSKRTKLQIGYLFTDNKIGDTEDDNIFRLSVLRMLQTP